MPEGKRVPSPGKSVKPDQRHLDDLLDEALRESFPASDPPAMLEPVPDAPQADEIEPEDSLPGEEPESQPPGT